MMQHCIEVGKPWSKSVLMAHGTRIIIAQLMSAQQLSQRRLAELAEIDQPSLSKYLAGQTQDIMAGNLIAIARVLGVSVATLAGETALADPKVATVVKAMETMPEYKKDAIVATSTALAEKPPSGDAKAA